MINQNILVEEQTMTVAIKRLIREIVKEEIKKVESVTTEEKISEMIDNALADFVESTDLDIKIEDKTRDTLQDARVEINTTAWVEVN